MNPLAGTGTSVGDLLAGAARNWPDREALVFLAEAGEQPRRWTFAELADEAGRLAVGLAGRLPAGSRVALWARNRPEWVITQLAVALAGLVLVPVNPAYGEDEAGFLLRTAEADALFHDGDEGVVARLSGELGIGLCARLADVGALAAPVAGPHPPHTPLPPVDPAAVAQIQFTSGTSGSPKGALLTHAGLTTTPVVASRCLGLSEAPRWLNVTPLFHIGGCVLPVMGCLGIGGTHVLGERYSTARVLDAFARERITFFGGVPTMWWDLLERHDPAHHGPTTLEVIMSGGAPVPAALVERAQATFGARMVIAYGQTEAHGHISQTHQVGGPPEGGHRPHTIGRPLPHTEVWIVRPDGSPADPGEPGELVCRSPTLMRGYLGLPAETGRALSADGALHTGDLCVRSADGDLDFVGRLSELINRGGEKIAPAEVEAALAAHPLVARVAVAGVPDQRLGERVAAFVVGGGEPVDADELARYLRSRLASYKVPEVWQVVDSLPVMPSGKVAKKQLVASWLAAAGAP